MDTVGDASSYDGVTDTSSCVVAHFVGAGSEHTSKSTLDTPVQSLGIFPVQSLGIFLVQSLGIFRSVYGPN